MYTIYHIEGVKIGCSKNPKQRIKTQGYSSFQVLEVHDDIQIASKREIELQLEYGYVVDRNAYSKVISMPTFEGRSKGGKKNAESGHLLSISSAGGKIGGLIGGKKNAESGQISNLGKINGPISMAIERICPYCYKTMKGQIYFRYHGDRCKLASLAKDI